MRISVRARQIFAFETASLAAQPSVEQTLRDGRQVSVRPAAPDDAARIQGFIRGLGPRTRYYRFCGSVRELPEDMLARMVQADGAYAVTLLALARNSDEAVVGLGEYVAQREASTCEIALVVDDAWQRDGVGSLLLTALMSRARQASLHYMEGLVLRGNNAMLKLVRARGFEVSASPLDPGMLQVRTALGVLARPEPRPH
jgi:acetyltransferase